MDFYNYGSHNLYTYSEVAPFIQAIVPPVKLQQTDNTDIFTYPQNIQGALELIRQALSGETEDRMFYMWLIEQSTTDEDAQIISGIRDNEIGHYALFRQLYYELTGEMPPQVQDEEFTPPASYCQGLANALLGEQNAVQKYRKILYAMQDRVHINVLVEIITDEIRHGILYSYMYAKNGCRGENS